MTLLAATQSLGIIELAGVSWINVWSMQKLHVAVFTMAILLPFSDPLLSAELHGGEARFWPDQTRLLEGHPPIQDQIVALHNSGMFGNLSYVQVTSIGIGAPALWIIKTHAGSPEERTAWLRNVLAMEGRLPGLAALDWVP
jgi:hypothetical protein